MTSADIQERAVIKAAQPGCLHLPLGLLGFERIKEYLWVQSPEEFPFSWLQSRTDAGLTFLVVPACEVLADYRPDITDEDAAFLELTGPDDALILGIVTLRPHGRATVNLKGPIVMNRWTRRGKQTIPTNAVTYALQHPLPVAE